MCCSAKGAQRILIFINLLFWLAGGCLLGLGVWMKIDPTIVNYLDVVHLDHTKPAMLGYAASIFLVVGAFVVVVSFLGCFGALRKNQGFLFLYACLVFVAIVAELIGSILTIVYWQKLGEYLSLGMQAQVHYKYVNGSVEYDSWNFLQAKDECCGAETYLEYYQSNWFNMTGGTMTVPESCCVQKDEVPVNLALCQQDAMNQVNASDYLQTKGCADVVVSWFHSHSKIMMFAGFVAGFIQLLGFSMACVLRNALRREKNN